MVAWQHGGIDVIPGAVSQGAVRAAQETFPQSVLGAGHHVDRPAISKRDTVLGGVMVLTSSTAASGEHSGEQKLDPLDFLLPARS